MPDITGGAPALVNEQAIERLPGWHKTEPVVLGPTRQPSLIEIWTEADECHFSTWTLLPMVRMAFPLPLADAGESEGRPKSKLKNYEPKSER
jgi:hypothetical protein